jgi:cell division septal protein FtsQ
VSWLALVYSRSVRGGLAFPGRRTAVIVGGVLVALALLYVGARETPVFAIRTIEITGGPPEVRRVVRAEAEDVSGQSLVALDGAGLVRDLEALPSVRSVTYDRAFPSTLRIVVNPERPLAVLHLGSDRWVISEWGRIIRSAPPGSAVGLPHFRLPPRGGIEPGSFVTEPAARLLLGALALVPKNFPARIYTARLVSGELTLGLRAAWGRPEIRLGEPVDVAVKLAAAGLVISSIPAGERGAIGYVDASIPERVVVGPTINSQVEP